MQSSPGVVVLGGLLTVLIGWTGGGAAAEQAEPPVVTPAAQTARPEVTPVLVFNPPKRGAPVHRVGGGTRSIGQLTILQPPDPVMTTLTQPRLYWFMESGYRNPLVFQIRREGDEQALLELTLSDLAHGGIVHVDLADHQVHLEAGSVYEWGVALRPAEHQRWPELVSRGRLVIEPPDTLLVSATARERPFIAARRGLWHDALDGVSRLIATYPDDPAWRRLRAELLEQGGLWVAARYERQMLE